MARSMIRVALAVLVTSFLNAAAGAATLDDVKARGSLKCGVNEGLQGFAARDSDGNWAGMDVDFCRAVAAAVFGDDKKVTYVPLSATARFDALRDGNVDLLARNTTWTAGRDITMGLNFAGVTYYDGQGFLVRRSLGVISSLQLDDMAVCLQSGTTSELNVADYFSVHDMTFEPVAFDDGDEMIKAYDTEKCDALTADASRLYAERLKMTNPDDHVVLPEIISKEPLGPVVREGDDPWFNLVKWVHFAMVNAEELEVTSENAETMRNSPKPAVRRLLGQEGDFGHRLGVGEDWAYNVIRMVGNYGEVFERNVGPDTPLAIARNINGLWSKGGIQYAPPIR